MRHEVVLATILIIYLLLEIFISEDKKYMVIPICISLFLLSCIIGFLPTSKGELFGGMYHTDTLLVVMKNILNIGVLIILIQSATWLKTEANKGKVTEFFMFIISTLIGMFYMISSGDFLMLYIGMELATIPMAILAAYDRKKEVSAEAGVKLIFSSALSSGILLFGISMIYGTVGSVYFDVVMKTISAGNNIHVLGLIFFFSGMAFKISIVPFHLWTADVYEGAPVNVTSYFSVISKGATVFILTIVFFTVFRNVAPMWKDLLYITAIMTMTVGNLFAMRQKNLKRFLAFSSIAQAGFILLGIISGTQLGMSTVIYFVLVYIFSNLGAFGVVSVISNITGKENMDDYDGLYLTNPKISLVMTLALFSLAGIPPVAGFFGKFFLFTAAASANNLKYYILVFIAVANTIISLYYYLLVVKAMFINKSETPIPYFTSDNYSRTGIILCVVGIVCTGFLSAIFDYFQLISFGI
jgi:NADH-quinone oxidoreductase subunit N